MGKKDELIIRVSQVRGVLISTTHGLTPPELTRELITPKWSIKDVFGHIASWQDEFSQVIKKFLTEERPRYETPIKEDNNWKEWNLAQWQKMRQLSFPETLTRFLQTHGRFVRLLEYLQEGDLDIRKLGPWGREASVEQIILTQIGHELEHGRQILDWRKKKKSYI